MPQQHYEKGRFVLSGLPQDGESITIGPVVFPFTTSTGTTVSSAVFIGDAPTVAELAQRIVDVINANDVSGTAAVESPSSILFTPYSGHTDDVAVSSRASNITVEGVGTAGVIVIGS